MSKICIIQFKISRIMLTFKIFFKWSTDISPLENLRLAYAARVDCNSYIMTPRNLDIPEIFINIKKYWFSLV